MGVAAALAAPATDAATLIVAVQHVVATLGRLDVLVNNAVIAPSGPLEAMTLEDLDRTLPGTCARAAE
ncbi:SDR family NAD(P)-dependent oxidoreductase [Nonomuraea terrae]|uniref:SDR family NAD(P)-dependent oxidoreductase n=1 Tax=Nonomuraea terrae TaxID=2530383 RepID=UPI001CB72B09|nr:SDR family NAD(P)-dependent oxidoreductase [Nonomuraea terrae]